MKDTWFHVLHVPHDALSAPTLHTFDPTHLNNTTMTELELEMQNIVEVNRYRNILGIPMIPLPHIPQKETDDDNVSDFGLDDLEMSNDTFPFDSVKFTNVFSKGVPSIKKKCGSKLSRGTLKRKVTGDGVFVPTKLSVRKRNMAEVLNYNPSDKSVGNKKRLVNAFTLGNVSSDMVPSSEGRRLLQVIHCICRDGGSVYSFFDRVPEIVASLRALGLKDVEDNDVQNYHSEFGKYDTFLRATFKNALCTVGKSEDYEFIPFVKYILQEKYNGTETMTASRLQALLGQICKENNTISREFPRFSYRKLGASKVSNVAFDLLIL